MSKYYIIPRGSEKPYQKLILSWHTGIDATEVKDGNFVLNEEAVELLDNYPEKTVTVNKTEVIARDILKTYPITDIRDVIFKEAVAETEIITIK